MKILRCPQCGNPVISETDDGDNHVLIKCSICGFTDYSYSFDLKRSNVIPYEHVLESLQLIKQLVDSGIQKFDITSLIFDINRKYPFLNPIVICAIINSLIDKANIESFHYIETLFAEYVPQKISLDDLINDNIKIINESTNIQSQKASSSIEEIKDLKAKCSELQSKLNGWEHDYYLLSEQLQVLTDENTSLKNILKTSK